MSSQVPPCSDAAPVVLKLGGSLLMLPDLFSRLQKLFGLLNSRKVLIVPGGGAAADFIRDLDSSIGLPIAEAHHAAIAAMAFNAGLLVRLERGLRLVDSFESAYVAWREHCVAVLDPLPFLLRTMTSADTPSLPASWDVTSDSIAAWTAARGCARDLILAKSCHPENRTITQLVAEGMVDPWFLRVLETTSVSWINLRSEVLEIIPLQIMALQ